MSLISATKPAQALSIYSNSYSSLTSPSSYSLLNSQPAGFGQSEGGFGSPRLLSDVGLESSGPSPNFVEGSMIVMMLFLAAWGLDTKGNGDGGDGETNLLPSPPIIVQPDPEKKPDVPVVVDPVTPVPTPAVLPGLLGMGLAAIRKRNLVQAD